MNTAELRKKLLELGIDEYAFVINGKPNYECTCIQEKNGKWEVFYYERGDILDKKVFETENEACEHMLQSMKEGYYIK